MQNHQIERIDNFGVFAILGAALDWGFFMNNRKAQLIVSLFGRTGARIFYCLLGTFLVVLGVLMVTGIVKDSG